MAATNIIPVSVESRFIALGEHSPIVAGNVGVDAIALTLDEEWAGYNVHVTFDGAGDQPTTVDFGGAVGEAWQCAVPWEQTADDCELTIGVQALNDAGDEVLNTQAMRIPIYVLESGEAAGAEPQQPTAGTLQRVEQDILQLEGLVADAPETIASIKSALEGADAAATAANDAAKGATGAAASATQAATDAGSAASAATASAAEASSAASAASAAAGKADASAAKADKATAAAQAVADDVDGKASAAKASATAAASSAEKADKSAKAAAASASEAATSQSGAATSATGAATSAATATSSSNSAAASATAASDSATAAATSAASAEYWAGKAQSMVDFTLEDSVSATSHNPVTSKGIYDYVAGVADKLRTGLVQVVDSLPESGESGIIYMVLSSSGKSGDMYSEYVWAGGAWEKLGDVQMPDLSPYAKTSDVAAMLAGYATTASLAGYATAEALGRKQDALTFDGTPTDGSLNPVTSAGIKAYTDQLHAGLADVATTGSYADLADKPAIPTVYDSYVYIRGGSSSGYTAFGGFTRNASGTSTLYIPDATAAQRGLMSAEDKAKLDAIADGDGASF